MTLAFTLHSGLAALALAASAAAQTTVRFPVIQDSWVNSNNTSRNYGSNSTTWIKHDNPIRTPYLQFQTYGITGTITSATIRFRFLYDSGTVTAHKANNETWDESTITYANQPGFATAASGSTAVSHGSWATLPVTAAVTGNGLFTFALRSTSINGEIYSKDSTSTAFNPANPTATNIPYLEVVYQPMNQAPVAQADSFTVLHNTLRTVTAPGVLSNDSDPNGDPVSAQLVTTTPNGTLTLSSDGSFTYLPANNFAGTDSFTYRAIDNTTGQSSPVTVTLNVLAAGVGQLTEAELNQIQTELGVTLNIDQQVELATLVKPVTIDAWRSAANSRIEQNRKANLNITVLNNAGAPVPGATVHARLKRKTFHFGGVLDLTEFMNGVSGGVSAASYRNLSLKYFDSVGLNNALKPKQSMYGTYNNDNLTNLQTTFFPWCNGNNIPVRGHLLMWPGGTFMSEPVDAKVVEIETVINSSGTPTQTQLDDLRALVDNEITTWAGMWNVYEWDVVNEVLGNHRIQDILGPNEIVRWFQLAQTASTNAGRPNTGRLINEYQIISGDALTNGNTRKANYKTQIQYLIDNNAPITAIGFQSRFRFRREDPALLYSRLEEFSGYNKDMVGTEFEVSANPTYVNGAFLPSENLRAQMTEEVMTTYYSHPKVSGLFAWEFVANPPPADPVDSERALLTSAGSPKLNALVWYYINRIRYHTDATLATDSLGQVSLRGFKGDYEITITPPAGSSTVTNHTLTADTNLQLGATVSTSFTHTLDVVHDSYVREDDPSTATTDESNQNFGNGVELHLRQPDGSLGRYGYLKFSLPALSGTVMSAKLRLQSTTETNAVQALAVASNAWTETTIKWNNRPAIGSLLGTGTPSAAGAAFEIDLPPSAIPLAGGELSFALNETGNSFGKLASSESTTVGIQKPQLVIVTGDPDNDGDGISNILDTDDDNDGIPDSHELLLGLDPFQASDATADPDGDGYSTWFEYAVGISPTSRNMTSDFISMSGQPDALVLTIRRRLGLINGQQVKLGVCSGFDSWSSYPPDNLGGAGFTVLSSTSSLANDAIGQVETLVITLAPTQPRTFFRLEVSSP